MQSRDIAMSRDCISDSPESPEVLGAWFWTQVLAFGREFSPPRPLHAKSDTRYQISECEHTLTHRQNVGYTS